MLFQKHSIADGQSWGMLSDDALDQEINDIADLPAAGVHPAWAALDKKIMERYVVIPRYYDKMAVIQGTNVGTTTGDPTMGMPTWPTCT